MTHFKTIHLPAPRAVLGRAARQLLEATLVPLGLFYLLFVLVGMEGGLFAALGWSLTAVAMRVVLRKGVPAVLVLTTILLVARTVIGYLTGDLVLYFLQPTLQNFLIAFVFLASASLGRPFIAKLAGDFCALPAEVTGNVHVQQFFRRVSLLWALVFLANGVTTLWILASATVEHFLAASTAGSYSLVALAAVASLAWFRRSLRAQGIRLRLGAPPRPDLVPA
ncbi:VC0807 family protein [Qaidamihabitans albus]|uniref:VC0807 family protein n=1 Tax=Qaidamihabitans albus TaxID=2795733 RepID=UPI0018F10B36|nr:VC0807 family protein [Qaidamihabitans albus]